MNAAQRLKRHIRLTSEAYLGVETPPFLVLFINSICNMKCEHCFYWTSLNQKDDLTRGRAVRAVASRSARSRISTSPAASRSCARSSPRSAAQFIRHNGVRQIYVPTNGVLHRARRWSRSHATFAGEDAASCSRSSSRSTGCRSSTTTSASRGMRSRRRWRRTTRWRSCRDGPATADPLHLHGDRRQHGRDPAADDVPVRALPADGSPQPGDHPRRPQESLPQGTVARSSTRSCTSTSGGYGRRGKPAATARSSSRCCSGRK